MCRDIISTLNKRPYLFVDTSLSWFIYLPVPCCAKLVYFTSPSGASLSQSQRSFVFALAKQRSDDWPHKKGNFRPKKEQRET
jgi:hypothetical protein